MKTKANNRLKSKKKTDKEGLVNDLKKVNESLEKLTQQRFMLMGAIAYIETKEKEELKDGGL